MPRLEQWEIKKYWEIFRGLKPTENKLDGDKLGPIFKNSQLQQDKLTLIWDLADIDNDGCLDFEEFCIAMRLIFDLVNANINEVPQTLPSWLIPGSKRHLVQADNDVQSGTISTNNGESSDTDDEYSLSSDFDWYISPQDKSSYEDIYNSNCDKYGRISFDSLESLYKSLTEVPQTDISYAWNIVNPKQSETIDKDQCLVYFHILNQRAKGKRIPRSVPASLRATFSKETPEFDIDSHQTQLNVMDNNEKSVFEKSKPKKEIDYSENKGKDWQEVELRRELTDLEGLIEKAKQEQNNKGKDSHYDIVKYEFEQLLNYKREQLNQISTNVGGVGDLNSILRNIDTIDIQVGQLEEFLTSKQMELSSLNQKIESLK